MSTTQKAASPRPPKGRHQSSNGSQPLPQSTNNGNKSQRRQKNNRAHNSYSAQHNSDGQQLSAQDLASTDSAVLSSEDTAIPAGPRNPKKHTNSQPNGERVFSPTSVGNPSLTDTEVRQPDKTTPAKAQAAYAGPTFHASPAPSTLPIPKFLSKSVPAKMRVSPPTPPPEEETSDSSSPTSSPSRAPVQIPPRQHDSPLDMLFKADKAERARNSNGNPPVPMFSGNERPHHVKHGSYGSLNTPFPFELDGDNRASHASHASPPVPSPAVHRSVTAPSNIPQAQATASPDNKIGSGAVHDLLNRLSMSQKNPAESASPKTIDHAPSDPLMRTHASPLNDGSPFRSSSGPTTPVPPRQQTNPDFFYGNRNLSPLFKAATKKSDDLSRNSGLRTQIAADASVMPQGPFSLMPSVNFDTNGMPPRTIMGNALNGSPNQQHRKASGRRPYPLRPDSHPNSNPTANNITKAVPAPSPKTNTMMAFVPSSVRAKPKAQQQGTTPPKTTTPPHDTSALEQDLKRMLNVGMTGNAQ
ncbi:hypothetical protein P280DRAFT_406470 [Massarina eburnea CBS 473.64]|uniref:Proteophosphoglycan 5 n=1 Tax=Massarina eburnea CBS 473.64 TaxID=1395130 RepID=A0A6A6RR33_9PLEO|nr:hypothetical protein P280DRAFT_406470 [Massarina eburnea CBS 473.64]